MEIKLQMVKWIQYQLKNEIYENIQIFDKVGIIIIVKGMILCDVSWDLGTKYNDQRYMIILYFKDIVLAYFTSV